MSRRIIAAGVALLAAGGCANEKSPDESGEQALSSTTTARLAYAGTAALSQSSGGVFQDTMNDEVAPSIDRQIPRSSTVVHVAAAGVPTPPANAIVSDTSSLAFAGLSHRDQRLAGSGAYANTQFSLEPPDQALCVGQGLVLESVNTALRIFSTSGTALSAPTALTQFFGLKPEIVRGTPSVFGDFVSDPKCYFDVATSQWFLTALQIDTNSATGAFGSHSSVLIATTKDPLGTWSVFRIDTTDDGSNGTPAHPGCPCLGDQPLIGADGNGFYVTTNEFSIAGPGFNGAQIYAVSKHAFTSGTSPAVQHIDASPVLVPFGGLSYSVQPATSPTGSFETANGGTEYFLSALDFNATLDDRIAVWALTNTSSLDSAAPSVALHSSVISSEVYGQPPNAQQRAGATPLGDSLHEPLELLSSNDDRMNQVVFAAGKLWSAVNTVVKAPNGPTRAGIAFFVVNPRAAGGPLSPVIANQGYVTPNQENALYPSVGVNASGQGVISFTLVGPDYFPSAAYARVGAAGDAGDINVTGAGAGPADGFTGYEKYGGADVARWGDYSAAVADSSGNVWLATEAIPSSPRTVLANWGTFISKVSP